jgi:internalin A
LQRRLFQPDKPLPKETETTKGIDIHRHEFPLSNGRTFRLNVWDFGGQEIYHATHQFFLTKRSLYVLVDDTRKDHKTAQDEGFKYWLEVVDQLSDHSPVLIFQNEKGGRSKTIDESGIKARFNNVKDVFRGDLLKPGSADRLRNALEYYARALPHIGEELPTRWVDIRAEIEARAKEAPYISQQDYFNLYAKHLPFDREMALQVSDYFHNLGVFLHFQDDPLLARTVILQNEWATEAVFRMLDDETVKAKLGRFTLEDCARVWRDSVYADMHPELLALMQNFELCYRLADTRPETWLAPQLLPPSKPAALSGWDQPGDLVLRYRYEFLPKGMISRLMVRQHRFVPRPEMGWVTGVLFERDGTEVLVEIPPKGGEIVLRARGAERKELLSVIAADLDALNDTFHGLREKVSVLVPCVCGRCRALAEPEFFEQKRLLQRKRDGKLKVECPASYEDVDVLEMLDGIRVDRLPGWAKEEPRPKAPPEPEKVERTIKIFLASSSELRADRDEFELYFRQQNDTLRKQGIYLQIVRWENFLDAMSETRLQDEYNKEIRDCDIFVSLFFTKTGKFTVEEFGTAHRQFKETGKPLIYTFFKNAPVEIGTIGKEIQTLLQFKEKLSGLGHFYTVYDNIEHLKRQFKDQLEKLILISDELQPSEVATRVEDEPTPQHAPAVEAEF